MKPITRGTLWSIDETFGVGDLADCKGQNTLNGEPSEALNIRDRGTLPSGERWAAGELAKRSEERAKIPEISPDGDIRLTHEDRVEKFYSAWAVVPGSFALVWEEWAADHLYFNFPMDEPEESYILLNHLYDAQDFSDVSSVGFKARQDSAEKGTVHGSHVPDDEKLGTEFENSMLNELRYRHPWNGRVVEGYVSASGYVDVYNPTDLTTGEYLHYVHDIVFPHLGDE